MLVKDLIDQYFYDGFRSKKVIPFLQNHYNINISICTLHR